MKEFHHFEHDISAAFTMRCCYWFAVILHERFPESRIMLAEELSQKDIDNYLQRCAEYGINPLPSYGKGILHFVTEIEGRLYDITGDVTDKYKAVPWDEYPEGRKKKYITDECIKMTW